MSRQTNLLIGVVARERVLAWAFTGFMAAASMWLGVAPARAATPSAPGSLSQDFKRMGPAVVVIRTSEQVAAATPGAPAGAVMSVAGVGSGVLVSADGKVVTAAHVVQTADTVDVEFPDSTVAKARIVASDAAADVALLQLERVPAHIAPARMGDSDKAEVGDQVFIVGAPLGITHTLTVGHVSARRQPKATYAGLVSTEFFQPDAAINRGNSGTAQARAATDCRLLVLSRDDFAGLMDSHLRVAHTIGRQLLRHLGQRLRELGLVVGAHRHL